MHRVKRHSILENDIQIITARQIALFGIVLGVICAVILTMIEGEVSYLLLFEDLLAKMVEYAIYGFGYAFCLNYLIVFSEIISNICDSVFSIAPRISLLSILIAIVLAGAVINLAFIPGIFIGTKAILDELLQYN